MNREVVDLCVVGAGISGLSLAAFACPEQSVCVVESNSKVGGILARTVHENSIFDHAANGWLDNEPSVEELAIKIGHLDKLIPANTVNSTRFLVYEDRLHPLSPKLLMNNTPLISWGQKFRALTEIFRGRNRSVEPTIAEWMTARFGSGILDNFVAPM